MKVNGPALGHKVTSLDPADAPNATAPRREIEKVSLALEMGTNVMLYLDDIQHTSAELLQKFISLCDAQRKIEGVWRGVTRTYDLRGKKFCVVMAGNPYTESGETFRIPDMLANRADVYNLGDVLTGKGDDFALSFLENALTSNPTIAPLATRNLDDVYKIIRIARGEPVPTTELSYGYSAVELAEIVTVIKHLFVVQETLLKVNQEYIRSAAQADAYRTEPPFKLQGSYRNMNKIAEKGRRGDDPRRARCARERSLSERIADADHGSRAEPLEARRAARSRMTPAQAKRWDEIKLEFVRQRRMGGSADDPVARLVGTISGLGSDLKSLGPQPMVQELRTFARSAADGARPAVAELSEPWLAPRLDALAEGLELHPRRPRSVVSSARASMRFAAWLAETFPQALRAGAGHGQLSPNGPWSDHRRAAPARAGQGRIDAIARARGRRGRRAARRVTRCSRTRWCRSSNCSSSLRCARLSATR